MVVRNAGTLLAALYTAVLVIRMSRLDATSQWWWFSAGSLIELALFAVLTWVASAARRTLVRRLALLAIALLGVVYVAQVCSVWVSGGLLTPLVLANYHVVGMISFRWFFLLAGIFVVACVLGVSWPGPRPSLSWTMPRLLGIVGLLVVYVGLVFEQPLARGAVVARGEAPITSFIHSAAHLVRPTREGGERTARELAVRGTFMRSTVYEKGFPRRLTRSLPEHPNIIVIFTEGMSARWLDTYGGLRAGLTPNLDRLAKDSLRFTNYYNHTAATFRGLRGQLTSGHQEVEGDVRADFGRVSLAEILRGSGYDTLFFLSQQTRLNTMLKNLGFDQVFGRNHLYDAGVRQHGRASQRPDVLTDAQLFDATLAELEARHGKEPFFAAIYNMDTHALLDGRMKFGDGKNPVLNRFHTYDRDVGRFVRQFMASPLSNDTVLVFTADHSTYPEPPAKEADHRIPAVFIDTIPLMIHWSGVAGQVIDVGGKNSLDLAPTLLSLLDIRKADNMFLGCTLFEECALDHLSNVDDVYAVTSGSGVQWFVGSVPKALADTQERPWRMVNRFKSIERD